MRSPLARFPAIGASLALVLALAACGQAEPAAPAASAPATTSPQASEEPLMPDDAPPQEEAPGEAIETAACRDEIGAQAAGRLVQRCIAVSPATHPPCNAANPCELIQDEITRSCAMFSDADRPAECAG